MPYDWTKAFLVVALFIAGWIGLTAALDLFAGFRTARRKYPDRAEVALRTLHFLSGDMGWYSHRSTLIADVCSSGLRVRQLWGFSPLGKPFFVPWSDLGVETSSGVFSKNVYVNLGRPQVGRLLMSAETWDQVSVLAPDAPKAA